MKVLVTGCTSSHSSETANSRFPSFTSLYVKAIRELGNEVLLTKPNIKFSSEYLDQFDLIVVGISSPTNISSHYSYAAFSVAEKARKLNKLKFIVDMPEPHRIKNAIRDFYSGTDNIFKSFYETRHQYDEASLPHNKENITSFIDFLHTQEWPVTYVPSMPWFSMSTVTSALPNLKESHIVPLCYDSFILDNYDLESFDKNDQSRYWCADSIKSAWTKKISKTINQPVVPYRQHNYETSEVVIDRINKSIGTLITTYYNNSAWWSPAISHSLLAKTPVVTDWRLTSELGAEWAFLPSTIETISQEKKILIAESQIDFYRDTIPNQVEALEKTAEMLDRRPSLAVL